MSDHELVTRAELLARFNLPQTSFYALIRWNSATAPRHRTTARNGTRRYRLADFREFFARVAPDLLAQEQPRP